MQRLGGAVVTRSPLTVETQVRVQAADWVDSVPHMGCLSPFTANAWWVSLQGFLPHSEGFKFVLILIGTVSKAKDGLARHCSGGHKTQVWIYY